MKSSKNVLFVIVLLLLNNISSAQSATRTDNAAKYFAYTNKAELQIVDSNYASAISFYDSAFSNLRVPLSQDMYNYAICAALNKKYEVTYEAIKFLIERGCDSTLFFRNRVFDDFKKQEQKRIHANYSAFISNRRKYVDSAIIKDILKMKDADQYYFRKRLSNLSNVSFMDSLQKNDDSITNRLKNYFSRFQYLHEGIIGGVEFSKPTGSPIFYVIVRHHYQNNKYDLTPILKKALEAGYIKPELYASWVGLEFQGVPGFGFEGSIMETQDSLYILKFPGIKSKIEENRKKIGLCTLEEQLKKTLFSKYQNLHVFLFSYSPQPIDKSNIDIFRKFTTAIPRPDRILTKEPKK